MLDPDRFWSSVLALSLFGALSVSFSAAEFTEPSSLADSSTYARFPKVSFISVNEWSIEELSVVIEDTSCLVISESATIIEREIIGKTGKCTDLSGGSCFLTCLRQCA